MQTKTIRSVWLTVLYYFDNHIKDKIFMESSNHNFSHPRCIMTKKIKIIYGKKEIQVLYLLILRNVPPRRLSLP